MQDVEVVLEKASLITPIFVDKYAAIKQSVFELYESLAKALVFFGDASR